MFLNPVFQTPVNLRPNTLGNAQEVWVGNLYTSIGAAIDSITDASVNKPYIVCVPPGIYSEQVTMKPYVSIKGFGAGITVITSNSSSTIAPASSSWIAGCSIIQTGTGNTALGTASALTDFFYVYDCYIEAAAAGGLCVSLAAVPQTWRVHFYNTIMKGSSCLRANSSGFIQLHNCKLHLTGQSHGNIHTGIRVNDAAVVEMYGGYLGISWDAQERISGVGDHVYGAYIPSSNAAAGKILLLGADITVRSESDNTNAYCVFAEGSSSLGYIKTIGCRLTAENDLYAAGSVALKQINSIESLNETNFTTHAKWDATGDMTDTTGAGVYTYSSGTGTLTQTQANLAAAGVSGANYAFTYAISGKSGNPVAKITNSFAGADTELNIENGTHTKIFTAKSTPGDFVISVTSPSGGAFTIDNVSLKRVLNNVEGKGCIVRANTKSDGCVFGGCYDENLLRNSGFSDYFADNFQAGESFRALGNPALRIAQNSYAVSFDAAPNTGLYFDSSNNLVGLHNAGEGKISFDLSSGSIAAQGVITAASTANPSITAGDGSIGYLKIGGHTISKTASGYLTFAGGVYIGGQAICAGGSGTYYNILTVYNTQTAGLANGAAINLDVKRTSSGQTNAARIVGTLTDIGDSTYKGAIIFQVANQSAPVEAARLDYRGYLGINCAPANRLDILGSDNETVGRIKINAAQTDVTAADTFLSFDSISGVEGSITGTTGQAGVISYNSFTGSHWAQSNTITATPQQQSVTRIVKHFVPAVFLRNDDGSIRVDENGDEIILEPERTIEEEVEAQVTVYVSDTPAGAALIAVDEMSKWQGEICDYLPKVEVSSMAMDKRVYGVYGGHDREGDILAIGLGAGKILVCDEGGSIEAGDFLCTSSTPGYAMKYSGNDMRYVVAKARQPMSQAQGLIAATLLAG